MVLFIVFLILICLAAGGFIGFKIGSHFIRQENITVLKQNVLLQEFSNEWANAARNTTQLTGDIADRQTSNLATTMQTVIQLLDRVKEQQSHMLNGQEQEKVTQLINQAKQVAMK